MLTRDATRSTFLRISEETLFGIPAFVNSLLRRRISKEGSLVAVAWSGRDLNKGLEPVTNISFTILQRSSPDDAYSVGLVAFPNKLVDIVLYNPKNSIKPEKLDGSLADIFYNSVIQEITFGKIEKWLRFSQEHTSSLPHQIKQYIDQAIQDLKFRKPYSAPLEKSELNA